MGHYFLDIYGITCNHNNRISQKSFKIKQSKKLNCLHHQSLYLSLFLYFAFSSCFLSFPLIFSLRPFSPTLLHSLSFYFKRKQMKLQINLVKKTAKRRNSDLREKNKNLLIILKKTKNWLKNQLKILRYSKKVFVTSNQRVNGVEE